MPLFAQTPVVSSMMPAIHKSSRYRFGTTSLITMVVAGVAMVTGIQTQLLPLVLVPVVEEQATAKILEGEEPEHVELEADMAEAAIDVTIAPLDFVFATKPGGVSQVEDMQADVEAEQVILDDLVASVQIGLNIESEQDAELPPTPSEILLNEQVQDQVAHAGEETDGLKLARIEILHPNTGTAVAGWLSAGMVTLEIHTPNGIFLGLTPSNPTGDVFRTLQYKRIGELANDPRSDLRMPPVTGASLPIEIIESRLGLAKGVFEIDQIDLVFTHKAAAKLVKAQDRIQADLSVGTEELPANSVHLALCIQGNDINVDRVTLFDSGILLSEPRECGR